MVFVLMDAVQEYSEHFLLLFDLGSIMVLEVTFKSVFEKDLDEEKGFFLICVMKVSHQMSLSLIN